MPTDAYIALEQDLIELNKLADLAVRKRAKDVLNGEIIKVNAELNQEKLKEEAEEKTELDKALNFIALNKYAWDQEKEKVKLYISLDGVEKIDKSNIQINATETTLDLRVLNLNNRNYKLWVKKLDDKIVVDSVKAIQKTNNLIVTMKKAREINWDDFEWRPKNNLKEKDEPFVDTQTSLMSLMKNLYKTGDDDMKRTIQKAWKESEEEQKSGKDK